MLPRALLCVLALAAMLPAQRRVDPRNLYHRIICVLPYVGAGTQDDPRRPEYAPPQIGDPHGIVAYIQESTDDGKMAVVEFVAFDAAAFKDILADRQIVSFVRGESTRDEIETAIRKYRHDYNFDRFGVVIP